MKCPLCLHDDTKISDSRVSKEGFSVRRRRECSECGYRFSTFETREILDLMVIKRNGDKERYSREKLFAGIARSLERRPVPKERINDLCLKIEVDLVKYDPKEISTKLIGSLVLKHLKTLDEVAYIRFASVYRDFKSIKGFKKEIEKFS